MTPSGSTHVTIVPAPLVRETFDRADENPLNVATDGKPWTIHAGTGVVSANSATAPTGNLSATVLAAVRPGIIKSNINIITGPGEWESGLQFRYVDQSNCWRFLVYLGDYYLLKVSGGSTTTAATFPAGHGGGNFELKVTDTGSQIKGYANGVEQLSFSDTTFSSARRCGLFVGHFYFDDVASWLDFEARV